jgi:two-component system sensor histidine kinase YesM
MYRKTFNRGRDLISIEDVMTSIACYLDIQKIRYGDTFDYEIQCGEGTQNLEILNLIIQTLVENAIGHGMDNKRRDGRIIIRTKKEGERLHIEVEDNGRGIGKEKLRLINASINSPGLESESGLRNVQKRIKLYYGNGSGIIVESKEGVGTTVKVDIPAIKAEDD